MYTIHGVIATEAARTLNIDIVPKRKQIVPSQLEMSLRVIFILIVIQGVYMTLGEMSRDVFDYDAVAQGAVYVNANSSHVFVAVFNTSFCATHFFSDSNSIHDLVNNLIH